MSALQSGQVHMVNRVEPKTVSLLRGLARRGDRARAVERALHLRHALQHAALRQQRPADGAEARDRPRGDGPDRSCRATATVGNDFPISKSYPYFPADIEQRTYDPEEAKHFYQKSGHSGPILLQTSEVAFPGAVDAAVLYQQQAAKAGITIEVSSASPATATGTRSGTSSPSAPPIGAAGRRRTACIPPPIIRRRTGTTRASCDEEFDKLLLAGARRAGRGEARAALSRHGGDGARRGRADPADVQRLHRRAHRQGDGLGAGSEHGDVQPRRADPRLARRLGAADDGRAAPSTAVPPQRRWRGGRSSR